MTDAIKEAAQAYVRARLDYANTPSDRGGQGGPKGKARRRVTQMFAKLQIALEERPLAFVYTFENTGGETSVTLDGVEQVYCTAACPEEGWVKCVRLDSLGWLMTDETGTRALEEITLYGKVVVSGA